MNFFFFFLMFGTITVVHLRPIDSSFKLIVFSFDGFRHDYVDPDLTPNLWSVMRSGVEGHMHSTFITKTFPNHQSIVTGLYQPWHGIVGNKFYDPKLKSSFSMHNESSLWWDQWNISVPIYIANQYYEPDRRYSIAIQWPGSIASYTDGKNLNHRIRVHYLQNFDRNFDWKQRIDLALKWIQDPDKPANLAFIYYDEPDAQAHEYGPRSSQVLKQVQRLDDVVGYFRKQLISAGLAHKTNIIFLSDHGMAEINKNRSMFLEQCDNIHHPPPYRLYGSSPVWSVWPNENVSSESIRDAFNECAGKQFHGKFRAYLQSDIPDSYHYKHNRRILPVFLVADEGYDINQKEEWRPKGYPIWGNHGYNASLPSMRPLFVATGPRFKRKYQHPIPFENIDLYPLMLRLLEIPLSRFPVHNGSIDRVQEMLSNHLYLDDHDMLLPNGPERQQWIGFVLFITIGFLLILLIGTCFVFAAGFNRKSPMTRQNAGVSENSKLSSYIRRIWAAKSNREPGYQMFSNRPPSFHLDESSTEDEDAMEDELYTRQSTSTMAANQLSVRNPRTDVDWEIMGTGLDIDLASQIDDNHPRKNKATIVSSDESETKSSSQRLSTETKTREFTSLLHQNDDDDDDSESDEQIKAKIDIELYENMLLGEEKPIEKNDSGNSKLIDI